MSSEVVSSVASPTRPFGSAYASYYDLIYQEKDYEAESSFLEELWGSLATEKPRTILDIGCGTGGHAMPLAARGYTITGVDASAPMIALAQGKAESKNLKAKFVVAKAEEFKLPGQWDVAVCMFNAINYLVAEGALLTALRNVRLHLELGGLFIFDFRNGIPSIRSHDPTRVKWVRGGDLRLLRISENRVDPMVNLFFTSFYCLVIKGDRVIDEFQDDHVLRYLFPNEVTSLLRQAGFEIVHRCPFLKATAPLPEDEWNVVVVAKAI